MARTSGGGLIGSIAFGVRMDTKRLNSDVGRARRTIGKFVGGMRLGVVGGAAAAGAALATLAKRSEDLGRAMNRSLAIMGDVSKAMRKEMTSAAIDVAAATTASSEEAAKAYYYLASAGLDAAQSLKALPEVAQFAQAGNFDLALATDLVTDAQSALGLSSKDAAKNVRGMVKVSDALVKANTLANASVQQFSEALTNKAGAALRLLNKDISEGLAVLAVYADQGVKGAEAGTALGIVLRDLQTKSIKQAKAFESVGVRVYDASGNMRNMAAIVADLENAMAGMSDQQAKSTLLMLGFSDKSVSFVQSLIGSSEAIKNYEAALRSAGGTTAEVAAKQLTPFEKSWSALSAAVDRLAAAMGENLSPLIEKLADALGYVPLDAPKTMREAAGQEIDQQIAATQERLRTLRGYQTGEIRKPIGPYLPPHVIAERIRRDEQRLRDLEARRRSTLSPLYEQELNELPPAGERPRSFRMQPPMERLPASIGPQPSGGQLGNLLTNPLGQALLGGPFALGQLIGQGINQASALPGRAARAGLGLLNTRGPGGFVPRGTLAFARSGSAESYRQRAENRRIRENQKLDLRRNAILKQIADNTRNGTVEVQF
jgi:TP901 family phage tail tape measure protein